MESVRIGNGLLLVTPAVHEPGAPEQSQDETPAPAAPPASTPGEMQDLPGKGGPVLLPLAVEAVTLGGLLGYTGLILRSS